MLHSCLNFNGFLVPLGQKPKAFKACINLTLSALWPLLISFSHYFPATVVFFQFLKLTKYFPDSRSLSILFTQNTLPGPISLVNSYLSLNVSSWDSLVAQW